MKTKTSPKWSLKKADWNKFQNACIDNITEPTNLDNIDDTYTNFLNQLNSAMTYSIPNTNPNHKKNPEIIVERGL